MVMAFYSLLRSNPQGLTEEQMKENLDGNYCRCTGYRPILDAMKSFAKDHTNKDTPTPDETGRLHTDSIGLDGAKLSPFNLSLEPIFPPYLMTHSPSNLHLKGDVIDFYRPTTLKGFLELRLKYPSATILSGNTRRLTTSPATPTTLISVAALPELQSIKMTEDGVDVGAAVTIANVRSALRDIVETQPEDKTASLRNIEEQWKWIAGNQVRNLASIGGSLVVGHVWGGQEASDVIPPLVVAGAKVTLISAKDESKRVIPLTQFVKGGNQVDLLPDEVLATVHIPFSNKNEYFYAYKQAGRQTSSASVVTAAARFLLEESGDEQKYKIKGATLCFGGVAAAKTAPQAEASLIGLGLLDAREHLSTVFDLLKQDYPLSASDGLLKASPRDPQYYPLESSPDYKHSLVLGIFFRFYNRLVSDALKEYNPFPNYKSVVTKGSQRFPPSAEGSSPLHQAHPHHTGDLHTTGEAIYTDDIAESKDTLYAALVLSTIPHGKVRSIDASEAQSSKGFVAFYDASDVPCNIGEMLGDGELFASVEVLYYGQPLGVVVATSKRRAERAAKLIKVDYEELPAIVTIKEALEAGSLYPPIPLFEDKVQKGNVEEGFSHSDVIIEGEFEIGGAFHWYMEPQSAYAVPREDGGLTVYATTQAAGGAQEAVAKALKLPLKDISVQVKRLGGGFGGKATRPHTFAAAALAGWKLHRPVKLTLDRVTDMLYAGTNAPHLFQYKAGATKDGKLQAVQVKAYSNGGSAMDFSLGMIAETLKHVDNSYFIPHFAGEGRVVRTNIAPTKPYRGAGIPQGIVAAEWLVDHMARKLGIAPHLFREMNFYKDGDITPFSQVLDNVTVGQTWFECRQNFNFDQKRKEVDQFNATHHFKKRGLAIAPVRYGIAPAGFAAFAKASVLVHIMPDGTVVCHHGGVEMGQGLQVKIAQICADALGLPLSSVYIPAQSAEVLPYGGMTGGSSTTEMVGEAVMNACQQLIKRLEPLRSSEAMKDKTWQEVIQAAVHMRTNLTAEGWNAPTWEKGQVFKYHSWNSAAVEVEVDLLTGAHTILRADLVQDVGRSLNPAVDIGQCEGAFMQGVGWLTVEDLLWDKKGRMDINYDIPMAENIPREYNVSLLQNSVNPHAIHGAKGIGEPPLCAGVTVALALKDAIIAARQQAGLSVDDLTLNLPLTPERTRLACGDLNLHNISRLVQGSTSSPAVEKKKSEE